jgi:CHAD domain-containing protein
MTARDCVETERKYQVEDKTSLPLSGVGTGARVGAVSEMQLDAVDFDTPNLDLHRRGISLRRRTGGDDEGWHVKVPRDTDQKTEIRHPLGRAVQTVPRKVVDPVRALVRDQPLVPVAAITTKRTAYALLGHDTLVATLCDDRVTGRSLLDHQDEQTWREWELEVVEGEPAGSIFAAMEPFLLEAGAHRGVHSSKVGRVLEQDRRALEPQVPKRLRKGSLGELLQKRLTQEISALHEHDAGVRGGSPEAIHRMRIAARRLRSALTTTRPLFTEPPDELREELRWLGQVLSPARDAQVIRERLEAALEAESRELVLGPVRQRLRAELVREERQGLANVREALDSTRYFRLLDALDTLAADLPLTPTTKAKARPVIGHLVKRDAKRLQRAVRAVAESEPEGRDQALHEVRKKAKRLRYAAELAAPAGGRRARRLAKRTKVIQQALGRHQDSVVARQRLRQLGAQAFLRGENGFTFGLLYGVERLRAEHAEQDFQHASARLPRPGTAAAWVSKR